VFINKVPGIDLNVRGPGGGTPLMLTCSSPVGPVIRALVAKGADVNAVDDQGASALRYAIEDFGNEDVTHFLLREGKAAWDGPGPVEQSVITQAARKGMAHVVMLLLRRMRAGKGEGGVLPEQDEAAGGPFSHGVA
jgi:26S proteasome non-ATPase regulatory subunit 10